MSTTITDRLAEAPDYAHGVPIGVGDWRLSVEMLLPEDATAYWGLAKWGSSKWSDRGWADITAYVRGMEWTRGADEPYGRPRIGELSLTLDNQSGHLSPFTTASPFGSPSEFGPGLIVRVGVRSEANAEGITDGWIPQITAIVDSWNEQRVATADRWIEVRAYETLRDLAQVDDNALASVVGLDDWSADRIERLLNATDWRYGIDYDVWHHTYPPDVAANFWALQSTDMAANRLAECYQAADSGDAVFRTARTGRAFVHSHPEWMSSSDYTIPWYAQPDLSYWPLAALSWDDPSGSTGSNLKLPTLALDWYKHAESNAFADSLYVPYDIDTLVVTNEDAYIVNDARYAAQGLAQQVREHGFSIKRYGRRTLVRTDFQNRFTTPLDFLAATTVNRRGRSTLRIDQVDIATSDRGDDAYLTTIAADIGVRAFMYLPDGLTGLSGRVRVSALVRSMTHRVTPRSAGSVTWSTSFALDTRAVQGFPAAQLPAI